MVVVVSLKSDLLFNLLIPTLDNKKREVFGAAKARASRVVRGHAPPRKNLNIKAYKMPFPAFWDNSQWHFEALPRPKNRGLMLGCPSGKKFVRYHRKKQQRIVLVKTSEAGNTLSFFARGKLQKTGEYWMKTGGRKWSPKTGGFRPKREGWNLCIWVNLATINFSIVLTRNQWNAWT